MFKPTISHDEIEAVVEVLRSGHLTTGARCEAFEEMFAQRMNAAYAVSVNSATAALHLALLVVGVGPGDIVFVPTLGFASDYQVVEMVGAKAVLIDSEPDTLCMDPGKLHRTIIELQNRGARKWGAEKPLCIPRAVIVIDYAGQMADYSALQQVCDKYNLILIEDASHALPAAWRIGPNQHWQPAGSVADLACFSFYANKPITTAEGGMIVTNSKRWALLSRQLRLHGFAPRSDKAHCAKWAREVCHMGFKYNLPDVGAALGIRQFEKLDAFWQGRRRVAAAYTRHLSGCPHLKVPVELPNRQHSWHLYPVRLLAQPDESKRNRLVDELYACGIECSVHWYPLHLHQYIRNLQLFSSPFHVAEEAYRSLISLPIYPSMTDHEVEFVADSLLKALKRI